MRIWSISVHVSDLFRECNFAVAMTMSPNSLDECLYLKWKFDWEELKERGIEGFKGMLKLYLGFDRTNMTCHEIELNESGQQIERKTELMDNIGMLRVKFELKLTPVHSFAEFSPYEELFQKNEITDIALIVEGKKIHVNKGVSCFPSFRIIIILIFSF